MASYRIRSLNSLVRVFLQGVPFTQSDRYNLLITGPEQQIEIKMVIAAISSKPAEWVTFMERKDQEDYVRIMKGPR